MNPIYITRILLAAGAVALLPWTAQAEITRQVEKVFTVQPGGTLTVSTAGGDVRVTTGKSPTVKVTAVEKIRASSEAEADKLLQKLNYSIESSSNGVNATAKYGDSRPWFHVGGWPPVEVSFTIAVPENYNASIRTSGGDIEIGDLHGQVEALTSGGDIRIGRVDGRIRAETDRGDIHLAQASGAAQLRTNGGNIEAGELDGPGDVFSRGGRIRIGSSHGGLKAVTNEGNLQVGLRGPLTGESTLSTTGGGIVVVVEPKTGFALSATTMSGVVQIRNLDVKVEHGGNGLGKLTGRVNAGGPLLKLLSSGGNILLRDAGGK